MLSTRIDSIRTARTLPAAAPLRAAPSTWQRPSPSSDLRATLSFPQSRRDNQYAKSNPVQHGRFAVMQNGPNGQGVRFPSGNTIAAAADRRETRPRVCKTCAGKLRNDRYIISFRRGRPSAPPVNRMRINCDPEAPLEHAVAARAARRYRVESNSRE